MSNDNKEAKKEELLEKQEACELTEEELEKVTGGKVGVIPLGGDPIAAVLADDPDNCEIIISRRGIAVGSLDRIAVKAAIDKAARR